MKRSLLLLLASALFFGCQDDNPNFGKPVTKVAFGSCSYQFIPDKKIYRRIADENPDLFIFGGDDIYGDFFALAPGTPEYIQGAYKQLFESPDFMYFRDRVPILPTWDDHDYGENDGTVNNPVRTGKRIRGHWKLLEMVEKRAGQWQQTCEITIEIEGEDKPALICEWITMFFV